MTAWLVLGRHPKAEALVSTARPLPEESALDVLRELPAAGHVRLLAAKMHAMRLDADAAGLALDAPLSVLGGTVER